MKRKHVNFIFGVIVHLTIFLIYWFTGYNRFGNSDPRGFNELIVFILNRPLHTILILLAGGLLASYINILPFGKD